MERLANSEATPAQVPANRTKNVADREIRPVSRKITRKLTGSDDGVTHWSQNKWVIQARDCNPTTERSRSFSAASLPGAAV